MRFKISNVFRKNNINFSTRSSTLNTGRLLMSGKIPLAGKAPMTNLTNIRSFTSVATSVNREGRPLTEGLGTLITLVRFFTSVHSSVHPQVLRIRETLAANVADVGFFPSVYPPVLFEMFRTAETLATVITEIKLCWVVALFVSEERPLGGQDTSADVAGGAGHFVGLHFGMHASAVGRELPPEVECVPADLAHEWLIAGMDVVVFLEVNCFSKPLVAVVALEGQVGLVCVPQHVNTESCQDSGFVVALLAHVAGVEVRLLVSRQVPKEAKLLRTVLAGQVPNSMTQKVLLVVALVSEDLVASLAEKLNF